MELEVIEQQMIQFYDDEIIVVVATDKTVYVPLRPICELIGVAWQPQARKLNSDPVLADVRASVTIRLRVDDARGEITSEMVALPLDYLNGWLFGINANRVKEEVRESVIRYQKECYKVLYEAFGRNSIAVRQDDELMQSQDPTAIAFRNALANARLARETYYLTQRVDEHERRLGLIEAQLSNTAAYVTQEQAQLVSEGVKAISGVLSQRSGQNEYGGTYAELYRRFGVTSYKHIPAARFDECINWLRQWWQQLTDDTSTPF